MNEDSRAGQVHLWDKIRFSYRRGLRQSNSQANRRRPGTENLRVRNGERGAHGNAHSVDTKVLEACDIGLSEPCVPAALDISVRFSAVEEKRTSGC